MTEQHQMVEKSNAIANKLKNIRRKIHQNPELSFQEYHTAELVAEALSAIPGMKVQTGVAKTGVIGTLSSGNGPTVAIRADMDALPIHERSDHHYRSNHSGVMHACGHDAHTAILLGAAELLAEAFQENKIQGQVKLIFQPAEENPDDKGLTGAPYMIQEGALDGVDMVFALHMCPWEPVGHIQIHDGNSMANVDVFQGAMIGTGGHAAYPHLSADPIWMLGPVLQALLGIVSRKVSPLDPSVISVTQIQAGTASNVIPTEVMIRGTLRSYDPAVRELLISEVEKAFSMVQSLGGDYTFYVERGEPALSNDPTINQWIRRTIKDLYPHYTIKEAPFGLGGEDFGYMTHVVPGAMFFLGCALPDGIVRDLHTPIFDLDESCLPIGASILAETSLRILKGEYQFDSVKYDHEPKAQVHK